MVYYLYLPNGDKLEESENLNELIKKSNEINNSKITTRDGKLVHICRMIEKSPQKRLHGGEAINLKNVRVYNKNSVNPIAIVNGIYYIYNGHLVNGRYAITKIKNNANRGSKYIFGYVNSTDFRI